MVGTEEKKGIQKEVTIDRKKIETKFGIFKFERKSITIFCLVMK